MRAILYDGQLGANLPDRFCGDTMFSWQEAHDLAVSCVNSNRDLSSRLFAFAAKLTYDKYKRVHSASGLAVNLVNERLDLDWCIECLREKCSIEPDVFQNWLNLGTAYIKKPDLNEAGIALSIAHKLNPKSPDVLAMWAALADLSGDNDGQMKFVKAAAEGANLYKSNYAMALAKNPECIWSDFANQYHFREKPFNSDMAFIASLKYYNQKDDLNLTVYVLQEQGLGDFIMMAPMLTWLSHRVGRVVFCSDNADLNALAALVPGVAETKLTPFDVDLKKDRVINLMDLMYWFGERTACLESNRTFDLEVVPSSDIDVGLNFTGNPKFWFEYCRGIYDETARAKLRDSFAGRYIDFASFRGSLVDLAKCINGLRLVVTTDTMIAHMAGALGVPCVVMLAVNRDWRWYHELYPQVVTVVQTKLMEWNDVVDRAIELSKEMLCES